MLKTRIPVNHLKSLYVAIEHGDELHRRWLKEAMEAWNNKQPIPKPVGTGVQLPKD